MSINTKASIAKNSKLWNETVIIVGIMVGIVMFFGISIYTLVLKASFVFYFADNVEYGTHQADLVIPVIDANLAQPYGTYKYIFADTNFHGCAEESYDDGILFDSDEVITIDTEDYNGYVICFKSYDLESNPIYLKTRVINIDLGFSTPPVITINGDNIITITVGTPFVDEGATYTDNFDPPGDIVGVGTVDIFTIGDYLITYDITDSDGNASSTYGRTIHVIEAPEDNTPPEITITGDEIISITVGTPYVDQGATYTDNFYPSGTIVGVGTVDINTPGEYLITYDITDPSGNISPTQTRTVHVIEDNTAPLISLNGSSYITINYLGT